MNKMNRRHFIEQGGKITLAAGTLAFPVAGTQKLVPMGNVFIHHVYFWLKEPANKEMVVRFEQALEKLVGIESIQSHHLGKPAETRREVIDSSYQYSLLTVFKDKAAHDVYQVHPVHDDFRKVANELCGKVLVYDSVNF